MRPWLGLHSKASFTFTPLTKYWSALAAGWTSFVYPARRYHSRWEISVWSGHRVVTRGRIATLGGPVDLRAALLRQPGGGFRLDGEARADAAAAAVVHQALTTFGLPDATGRYRIQVDLGVSALP